MEVKSLKIEQICIDGGTQARQQLDGLAISEYAAAMKQGDVFPPVIVFRDGETYWLADGFHRIEAALRAEKDSIAVEVRSGGKRKAILYSVGANASHGVRRTNRDKRKAVELLLNDEEWAQWSDREIARRCGVGHVFVNKMRAELSVHDEQIPKARKVTRNGTTYTIDTTNIGVTQDEPEPQPTFDDVPEDDESEWVWTFDPEIQVGYCKYCYETHSGWTPGADYSEPTWVCQLCDHATVDRFIEGELPFEDATDDDPEDEPVPVTPQPAAEIAIHNIDACYLADYTSDVQLVITSPPYNVGIDYDSHSDDLSTYYDLLRQVWAECHKAMVEGGRICVVVPFGVGRNPWHSLAGRVMDTLVESGFTLRGQIIWDKGTSGNRTTWGSFRLPTNPGLRDTTECVIVGHKDSPDLPLPDELRQTDDKGSCTAWLQDSNYFMELAQDHWAISPESAQRVKHPAPFPVELVRRLIHFYGYPGCHVLDPFAGSGTVGVAAKELGCKGTLFEISQSYCELAERRIHGN